MNSLKSKTKPELIQEIELLQKKIEELKSMSAEQLLLGQLNITEDSALNKSAEKFYSISNQSMMAILIIQEDRFKYMNQAFFDFSGYKKDEFSEWGPKVWDKIIHPDDRALTIDQAEKKQSDYKNVISHHSYRIITKAGKIRWLDQFSKTITFNNKPADLVTAIDITERKVAEEAYRESEQNFNAFTNQSSEGISVADLNGNYTFVNPAFCDMVGWTEKELLGMTVFDVTEDHNDTSTFKRTKTVDEGSPVTVMLERKDGSKFVAEVIGKVLSVKGKKSILGTIRDITEQKRAETEIKNSELKYKNLFENSGTNMVILNREGTYQLVNTKAAEALGGKPKDFVGKSIFDLFPHDIAEKHLESNRKIIDTGVGREFETTFDLPEGKKSYLVLEQAITNADNRGIEIQSSSIDITERKLAEDALHNIAVSFAAVKGKEFFTKVSEYLADKLNVDYAFIGELVAEDKVKVVGGFGKGSVLEPFVYDLINTPCENVMEQSLCCIKSGVQKQYPKDLLLVDMSIDGYFVAPLFDSSGKSVGIIALLKEHPITNQKIAESTLQIFSDRVSAEIQRMRADETLRESEERFRDLVEKAGIAVLLDDRVGNFTYFNQTFIKLFGYSAEEIKDNSIQSFVHPEDLDRVMKIHKERLNGKNVTSRYEFKGIKKDGSIIYLEVDAVELKDGESIVGTRSYIWDITLRTKAERNLIKSEERFKNVVEATGEWIWEIDKDGLYTYSSKVSENLLGYKPDEIIGKKYFYDFFKPDVKDNIKKAAFEVLSKKESFYQFQNPNIHKDGQIVILETSASPFFDSAGNLLGYRGANKDITNRILAEKEIRDNAARFNRWKNSSFIGIILSNAKGNIIDANDTLLKMLGYSKQDLTDGKLNWTKLTPPEFLNLDNKALEQAEENGFWAPFEKEYFHKDGHRVPILIGGSVFKEINAEYIVFIIDITASKKVEEILKDKMDKLERFNKVMVDRELKMIDLKKEINELLKQLGKSEKYNIFE